MTSKEMIAAAKTLVVVNDGAYCWAGSKTEVYGWLSDHDFSRGFDASHNTPNSVTLTVEQYQALCNETECLVDTSGSYGPTGADPHELIEALQDAGAACLYIH